MAYTTLTEKTLGGGWPAAQRTGTDAEIETGAGSDIVLRISSADRWTFGALEQLGVKPGDRVGLFRIKPARMAHRGFCILVWARPCADLFQ